MFSGYMAVNGIEVLNSARTKAYVDTLMPGVGVKCAYPSMRGALAHNPYTNPRTDAAPWYNALRPSTSRFYGFYPIKIEKASDSTQKVEATELTGDGGVFVTPRYEVKEIRVVCMAMAADDEALADGLEWLKDVLENGGCREGYDCVGREVQMFHAAPATTADAASFRRTFYGVATEVAPHVTKEFASSSGAMQQIEFVLAAGIPWAFTDKTQVATLNMDTALNFTDPVGENCSVATESADNFINDPFFTGISQAPQPPNILPPNVLAITSWRRHTAPIGKVLSTRPGRITPVVTVLSGPANAQYIRMRFYRSGAGVTGCDYSGEFLISYLPANSIMVIDGIRKQITVTLPDGRVVPGGHLMYGSAGRPFQWPDMSCHDTYTMTADMFPGQTGITIGLEVAVRE